MIVRQMLTQLFPWQTRAVEKLLPLRVGALYMEQGTGKTRTALEIISRRSGRVDRILWLCPCSIIGSIRQDISRHCVWDKSRLRIHGIESLSSSIRLYDELDDYISGGDTMLVVDESNLVKNHQAIRTQNVSRLAAKCKYRLILNGTPISRNMGDLYAQWALLDWRILGYRSFWAFAANHLEFDPERPGRVVRAHHVDYIARKLAPYAYMVRRSDCMDLPAKRYHTVSCYLEDAQCKHYFRIADQMLLQLDDLQPSTIYRMFSALQAIISGKWVQDDGKHFTTQPMFQDPHDNPRITALLDLLEQIGDQKTIIFCKFSDEITAITSLLGSRALRFDGTIPQRKRQEVIDRFKADAQYLVANKTCAGYGLNLQFCTQVVYYSNDWDLATRLQSEDRVYRLGQTQPVDIYDICAAGTLDVAISNSLQRKESLMFSLIGHLSDQQDAKDIITKAIKGVIDFGKGLPGQDCAPGLS